MTQTTVDTCWHLKVFIVERLFADGDVVALLALGESSFLLTSSCVNSAVRLAGSDRFAPECSATKRTPEEQVLDAACLANLPKTAGVVVGRFGSRIKPQIAIACCLACGFSGVALSVLSVLGGVGQSQRVLALRAACMGGDYWTSRRSCGRCVSCGIHVPRFDSALPSCAAISGRREDAVVLARWLESRFGSFSPEDVRGDSNFCLRAAAKRCDGDLIEWLSNPRFGLAKGDVLDREGQAVFSVCSGCENSSLFEFLVRRFDLSGDDLAPLFSAIAGCGKFATIQLAGKMLQGRPIKFEAVYAAAVNGDLPTMRWLSSRTSHLSEPNRWKSALLGAISGLHRHVVEWLLGIDPNSGSPVISGQVEEVIALSSAIAEGRHDIFLPLLEAAPAAQPLWGMFLSLALAACGRGQVESLMWIQTQVGLAPFRAHALQLLTEAAAFGHVSVLNWLSVSLGLSHAHFVDAPMLRAAASSGRLEALKFIAKTFALDASHARIGSNYALSSAIFGGHIEVVRFLVEKFGLTADDAIEALSSKTSAPNDVLKYSRFPVACIRWAVKHFSLTSDSLLPQVRELVGP